MGAFCTSRALTSLRPLEAAHPKRGAEVEFQVVSAGEAGADNVSGAYTSRVQTGLRPLQAGHPRQGADVESRVVFAGEAGADDVSGAYIPFHKQCGV